MIPGQTGVSVNPSALAGGGPALNPLAAALMQGAMPNQAGSPAGAPGGQLLQTGGAVPGAVPIGAPTNQFGNVPVGGAPGGGPAIGRPGPAPGIGLGAPAPAGGMPVGGGVGGARPFGFGGMGPPVRPQGY